MYQLLTFDEEAYSLTAIQKAAYRASKYITTHIKRDERLIHCELNICIGVEADAFLIAVENFQKDVIDYQLREKISLQTEPIRNLILGLTFSKTGLTDEQI